MLASLFTLGVGQSVTAAEFDREENETEPVLPSLEIKALRDSLVTANAIKREKLEVVDSVVASEISKLPDMNLSEALSRVTGVQILRDRGEGAGLAIRGLTQVESTLNGREIFTAGPGRGLDFTDIPSGLLSGVDVYKTSSADHIEGGLGGRVDIRTKRPLDLEPGQLVASFRQIHGDLVRKSKPQVSILASDRWSSGDGQQIGALFNVSYQERAWREDQTSIGGPKPISLPGKTVFAPNGWTDTVTVGNRERTGISSMLQWQPSKRLDLYAEANHTEFKTFQDGYQLFVSNAPLSAFAPGSVALFPGTSNVQRITWLNPSITSWGTARDTVDRTTQIAIGGSWSGDELLIRSDLSHTRSHNNLSYSGITLAGTAASATQDSSGGTLVNPTFTSAGLVRATRPFDGQSTVWQLDGEYTVEANPIKSLCGGLRIARRQASDAPGQVAFSSSGVGVGTASGLLIISPYTGYLVGSPALARNFPSIYATLGAGVAIPNGNPLGTWDISERTDAAYLMAKLGSASLPIDGNAGVRIVRTQEDVTGNQSNPSGGIQPVGIGHHYTDILPSANLRYQASEELFLRGALSKTLTRPDFDALSPFLSLNPTQPTRASAGNPDLMPIRSNNLDISIERYSGKSAIMHATIFAKQVRGFISTVVSPENYGGIQYQVSRPKNSAPGEIRGLELGYQQFYDFLPGWMQGLGLQANYTYVESKTPSSLLGQSVPLQSLSRNSYNFVGLYERGIISARIAYNWRSKFMTSIDSTGIGPLPVYTKAYGWLDASLTIRLDKNVSVALEGSNLLRTKRESYYGDATRPKDRWSNDLQLATTLTISF